jgi:dolichol-phosphate mannosyltransferase
MTDKEEKGIQTPVEKDEVTIVIPVLDEEKAIGRVLDGLKNEGYNNLLVVDGYSQDNTVKIAKDAGAHVIVQHDLGKAGAIKTAIEYIETPYLLVMDGDNTYSPKDIDKFLIFAEDFDQILGNRAPDNISRLHRIGNWIINTILNVLFGSSISDVCTGMYMMKTDVAKKLEYNIKSFNVEVALAIQNIWTGSVIEVPIEYGKRLGTRKLSTWKHGLQILWTVIRMSFTYNPLFFLSALGALLVIPGSALIILQFYLRLRFGGAGWTESHFYLGLILFIIGVNALTMAMNILLTKRQERRIILEIRSNKP